MIPKRIYLRVDEVAEILCCDPRSVRRMCEKGLLFCFRLGEGRNSPLRVRRDSLEAFINAARESYESENGIFSDNTDITDMTDSTGV